MRWFYCNAEDFVAIECINTKTNKHIIRLSPNTNFVQIENTELGVEQGDTRFLVEYINNIPTLEVVKNILISLQKEYDKSYEINSFYINEKRVWLDNTTRIGITDVLKLKQSENIQNTTLWFDNEPIELTVSEALNILTQVKLYAEQCNNITEQHLNQINNMNNISDCLAFDITNNYPAKLNFTI